METTKSELDLMVELSQDLLIDIANCAGYEHYIRDISTMSKRVASEGVSFLTKTLPALGKAFDSALSKENMLMDYIGFKKLKSGYPGFLGGLFRRVFDHEGRSLRDASPSAVRYIRQILYLWYKYELPYTPTQEAELESRFEATDASLPDEVPSCPVIQGARMLIARVCADYSHQAVVPRHGPGAVATREQSWEKYRFKRLYQTIEREFPFTEWYVPSISYLARQSDPLKHLEVLKSGTARAVFVQKDSRGPRLISCEPLEYQWIQQGVAAELIYCINKSPFTSGRVNFTHQTVNRRYAQLGSLGAGWVTLDMADASDRVSTKLVETLFGQTHILPDLLCCRSECTVLPSGRRVSLKKFAPMGSALCFPVESLVFFALAVNVLVHHLGYSLQTALERVKVYGDDIICGEEDYLPIMQYFPHVGLKFNDKKCCTSGFFRESCGMDAFKGEDVTPIKIRTRLVDHNDSQAVVSAVEYSNMLDLHGYEAMARTLQRYVTERLPRDGWDVPVIGHDSDATAYLAFRRHDPEDARSITYFTHGDEKFFNEEFSKRSCSASRQTRYTGFSRKRWNIEFQRYEVLAVCVGGLSIKRDMPGWERLFANLADYPPRSATPYRNVSNLMSSKRFEDDGFQDLTETEGLRTVMFPLRRRVTLKRRWCAHVA